MIRQELFETRLGIMFHHLALAAGWLPTADPQELVETALGILFPHLALASEVLCTSGTNLVVIEVEFVTPMLCSKAAAQ